MAARSIFEAVEELLKSRGVLAHFAGGQLMTGTPDEDSDLPILSLIPTGENLDFRTNTSRYDKPTFRLAVSAITLSAADRLEQIVMGAVDDGPLFMENRKILWCAAGNRDEMEEVKFWKLTRDYTAMSQRGRRR